MGDYCEDTIPIGYSEVIVLEHEHPTALGSHIAITRLVKNIAVTMRREHARLGKYDKAIGMQVQTDPASQCMRDFSCADSLTSLMKCNQGRRAGRIDRHARTTQIKEIRYPVSRNARCVACRHCRVDRGHILRQTVGIVRTCDPDIDPAGTSPQGRRFYPCIL